MIQRVKLGKEGMLHTVEVDGVIVGQSIDKCDCKALVDELNESDEKCKLCKEIFE